MYYGAGKEANDVEHVLFLHLLDCSYPYVFIIIQVVVIFKVTNDAPVYTWNSHQRVKLWRCHQSRISFVSTSLDGELFFSFIFFFWMFFKLNRHTMNLTNGLYPDICNLYIWALHWIAWSERIFFFLTSGSKIVQEEILS